VRGEGRLTAEVDEAGNAISTDGTFVSRFEDGSIEFATGGPSPGTRLEVLPVLPLETLVGTPVAATPVPQTAQTTARTRCTSRPSLFLAVCRGERGQFRVPRRGG
jgi:hypothetical protein